MDDFLKLVDEALVGEDRTNLSPYGCLVLVFAGITFASALLRCISYARSNSPT